MTNDAPIRPASSRLEALDAARGVALFAMAIYHLSWDLYWFRITDWPVDSGFYWRLFAIGIASSFLFLVGVSLTLAHQKHFNWRSILIRLLKICAAAALISLGTWFALSDQFVRFGILHCIALASLLALPFLRWPIWCALLGVGVVLTAHYWAQFEVFSQPWLLWTGLSRIPTSAVDFVPIIPWFAAVLTGVATARIILNHGGHWSMTQRLTSWSPKFAILRALAFCGRHSLAFYLLHQPLLFGLVWAALQIGALPDPAKTTFIEECAFSCAVTHNEEQCRAACACTAARLSAEGTWSKLTLDPENPELNVRLNETFGACLQSQTSSR